MRKFCLILTVLIILSSVYVSAADHSTTNGTVLYHQDFSAISDINRSGIKIGTGSTGNAFIDCPGDDLDIRFYDKGRAYLILPSTERGSTYTVEFSFSFDEHESENGYLAFMLNCRGEEPTNVSEIVFRHNGSIDDFSTPDPLLSNAVSTGERINVTIPIENNILDQIHVSVGETKYTLVRDKVIVLESENFGFSARNTNVNIYDVFVVSGVEYVEKIGYYADNSFATDENPVFPEGDVTSPDTSDDVSWIVWAVGGSAVALVLVVLLGKKRK